jgi:hypothetical protein
VRRHDTAGCSSTQLKITESTQNTEALLNLKKLLLSPASTDIKNNTMNPQHEINSWHPMSTDDQALPPPIMVQAYLVVDGDSDQQVSDRHQLPPITAQVLPVDDPNQCTFRTVSLEYSLPDGTVMIHTEKLAVYPDGSVQVLESRDDVKR